MNEKTLMVDDQQTFHRAFELACKMLRLKNVKLFLDSDDLLNHDPTDDVATVLSDWNLIGSVIQHGELIEKLCVMYPNAKIYVVSTSQDDREIKEAQDAGASGWIVKTNLIGTMRAWQAERNSQTTFKVWK